MLTSFEHLRRALDALESDIEEVESDEQRENLVDSFADVDRYFTEIDDDLMHIKSLVSDII